MSPKNLLLKVNYGNQRVSKETALAVSTQRFLIDRFDSLHAVSFVVRNTHIHAHFYTSY